MSTSQMSLALHMLFVGSLSLSAFPAWAQQARKFEPFEFPTGVTAWTYTMLELKRVDRNHVETLVEGKSQKSDLRSYTRRIVDCRGSMRVRTLGSHDNLDDLKKAKPDTRWADLVPGSSAHGTAVAACSRV